MKLRNKKTGEIVKVADNFGEGQGIVVFADIDYHYTSIAELNDDWEDYKPTEPLIKDEKIRKVVRAWADVNNFEPDYELEYFSNCYRLSSWQADIDFNTPIKGLEDGAKYTLIELCGEV